MTNMHCLPSFLTALCLAALPLTAIADAPKDRLNFAKITEGENRSNQTDRWTCIIGSADKAMTMVKLSAITSISKQSYILQGTQQILEVTIDTIGNNSIRFYCLSSERLGRAQGRLSNTRELLEKHTEGATKLPEKTYPDATHSHNIEYRLSSPELVNRIYESVTHAWVSNTSANLFIKD